MVDQHGDFAESGRKGKVKRAMQVDALEKLSHVAPNSPQDDTQPFDDKRFSAMWCPFHGERKVLLLVYLTDWGELSFLCNGGCPDVHRRIENLLAKREPNVTGYVTANGTRYVYESRWSLGVS